jgi:aminoglycoside phosphotransferase (APT) family kinase protein
MQEYCERQKMPLIENWNVYMAFTLFRVAAILQGVYKRSLKGCLSVIYRVYNNYFIETKKRNRNTGEDVVLHIFLLECPP